MKIILSLLLVFTTLQSFAFDTQAHRLICQLAYQQLSLSKQQNIDFLVQKIPKQEKHRINRYLNRNINAYLSFNDSCVWADAIKSDKKYQQFNRWHFINIARDQEKITDVLCKQNCITHALTTYHQQFISNKKTPHRWQKTQALLFIAHWLADLHQPLHVSFKSDLGGNLSKVNSADKRCNNLHAIWDHCLIWAKNKNYQQLLSELESPMVITADDSLTQTNIISWANESLRITRDSQSQYCELNNMDNYCAKATSPINLSENYYADNRPVITARINKASVRLYAFLDKNF